MEVYYIKQIIDNNRDSLNDLWINHFLIDLWAKEIINNDEIDELQVIKTKENQNCRFLCLLAQKNKKQFRNFCDLLALNDVSAIKNLGEKLLKQLQTAMEDSHHKQVIDNNRHCLIYDWQVDFFLVDLRVKRVINDDEYDTLEAIKFNKDRNYHFLRLLAQKDEKAFRNFCNLLARSKATAIKNLGKKLLKQIDS